MGAWRQAWDAGVGAPWTEERVEAEAALGPGAVARARKHLDRGEVPDAPAEARLVAALARERVARLDVPAARRPWVGVVLVLVVVAAATGLLASGEGPAGAVVAAFAVAVAWPLLRQPVQRRRAECALAGGEEAMRAAGIRPRSRIALARAPTALVAIVRAAYAIGIFAAAFAVRVALDEDVVDALVGAGVLAVLLGPTFLVMGRRRYVAALRALAA